MPRPGSGSPHPRKPRHRGHTWAHGAGATGQHMHGATCLHGDGATERRRRTRHSRGCQGEGGLILSRRKAAAVPQAVGPKGARRTPRPNTDRNTGWHACPPATRSPGRAGSLGVGAPGHCQRPGEGSRASSPGPGAPGRPAMPGRGHIGGSHGKARDQLASPGPLVRSPAEIGHWDGQHALQAVRLHKREPSELPGPHIRPSSGRSSRPQPGGTLGSREPRRRHIRPTGGEGTRPGRMARAVRAPLYPVDH